MSIKDKIWLLAHSKEKEDRREWAVLYWKSTGMTHRQVADQLGYSKDWVQRYMGKAHDRFETPKDLDSEEKYEWLQDNVFPALKEFVQGEPDTLKELPPPPEGEPPASAIEIQPAKPIIIVPPVKRSYWRLWLLLFAIIVGVTGLLVVVGVGAYYFGTMQGVPQAVEITVVTEIMPTPVPSDTPVPISTTTPAPTLSPTIPPPTRTPKAYYDEEEIVTLADGIHMYLSDEFSQSGGWCSLPEPGFGVTIRFENTINEQYPIRFSSEDFSAVDDLGNIYELEEVSIGSDCYRPGTQVEYMMDHGKWEPWLIVNFSGQIPLEAQYIFVTADWISGIGPTTFRKSIY